MTPHAALGGIRLVLTDCDGVLTDGGVYVSARGEEMKRFSVRDGMGVERLRNAGIPTGIITRERSDIVIRRAEKLRIAICHLGVYDKVAAAEAIATELGVPFGTIAYIGDDVNDLDLLRRAGFSGAPADAEPEVLAAVHFTCSRRGGHGAFREFADHILGAQPAARAPNAHD